MKLEIVICMGSSCFSRGNRGTLEFIETYLADRGLAEQVALKGSRCEDRCPDGPNIQIGDETFGRLTQAELKVLLDRLLKDHDS